MAYTNTKSYAGLYLTADKQEVAPGGLVTVTVDVTLLDGYELYEPEVEYKLFLQLPGGLSIDSVANSVKGVTIPAGDGSFIAVEAEKSWTGGPDEPADIVPRWDLSEGDARENSAYAAWLLATWKSSLVMDDTLQTLVGWTVDIKVASSYHFPAGGVTIRATLIAFQGRAKDPLSFTYPIQIYSAGPAFASIQIPASPVVNGHSVVATGTHTVRVRATLAQPTTAATIQVRWQVLGAHELWAEPQAVTVTHGTQLAEFTIAYDFAQPETLRFSCAEAGGSDWGTPVDLYVTVISDLLVLENPLIRMDAEKITLSCQVKEPSAQVKFASLELSTDGGTHWKDITDKKTGTSSPYTFSYDITGVAVKERDFSAGVYLRATDNLQRVTPSEAARFDAETFLSAAWDGASATLDDINSGEALTYSVHLHCAQGVVLPPATLALQLPETAVVARSPANSWYWMLDEDSGEPQGTAHDAASWRGTTGAAQLYRGPIQTGLINAVAHIRTDEGLLGNTLPPATLTLDSRDFFVKPFTRVEPVRAQVYRPAPCFEFVSPVLHTHQDAVSLRGIFTPPVEPAADLRFAVTVDQGAEHDVTPTLVNTNYFELKLDPAVFTAFSQNGKHNVQLAVRRSADNRPVERSSYRETLEFVIDNT